MEPDHGTNEHEPGKPAGAVSAATAAEPGLPPVAPPSGRFILRMFLVPGLIVGLVVLLLLFFNWLTGSGAAPDKILKALRDGNPEVRWREASELPVKLSDPELGTNVSFGLSLVEILHDAVEENQASERSQREKQSGKKDADVKAPKWLVTERDFILYLIPALGHLHIPVGAPQLRELALLKAGVDAEYDFRRRHLAVLSLSMLGDRLSRFDELPAGRRKEIMTALREEADGQGDRAVWARESLGFLEKLKSDQLLRGMGVGEALLKCAAAEEPFVRQLAAHALNFWDADGAEEVLVKLLSDDGRGDDPVTRDPDQQAYRKAHPEEIRKLNQKQISYNAMQTLLRRGSPRALSHLDLVREMLDEETQRKVWDTDEPGQKSAREANALETIVATCSALKRYLRTHRARDLSSIQDAVRRAMDSDNKAVRAAAKDVYLLLKN